MPDILGYLQSKAPGPIKRAGGSEVHTPCWWCGEDQNKRGRLYINVNNDAAIPGLFQCKICGKKGAFPTIQRYFGDEPEHEDSDSWMTQREVLQVAADFYHDCLADHSEVLSWLKGPERGLSLQTIVDYKLGYADGRLYNHLRNQFSINEIQKTGLVWDYNGRLRDSLIGMVTIPYFVAGNVAMIRGRAWPYDGSGQKYKTPPNQSSRLYGPDATWDANELICTEGEFDCLILRQLGFPNVVASPGAGIWQDSWDGYLSQAKRVFVVFDNDSAGALGRQKLKEKFDTKIRPVDLPGLGKMDPTRWVQDGGTKEQFQQLLFKAASSGMLLTVDDAVEEHSELQTLQGLKLGFEKLDVVLAPGLLPGQVMVILAKTNVGKSLILFNMFERMLHVAGQENKKVLFLSLEMTRGDWFERARRIWRFYNLAGDDRECAEYWRSRIMMVDKNRMNLDEVNTVLDEFNERTGQPPDLVAIDYLGYWARAFRGDPYIRVSDAIMEAKGLAKDRRLRLVIPHQISRVAKFGEEPEIDNARDSGIVEETADFALTMWAPDAMIGRKEEDKSGIVNLRVGKSRHGGKGVQASFQFAPLTLAFVPMEDQRHASMAARELDMERRRDTWEDAIYKHREYERARRS